MAGFTEQIARANVPIPETITNEIIQEAPKASAMLTNARKARMSTKTMKQPVLSVLPEAYWLSGDTDLKQTTHAEWEQLVITAEELAVLVPVPNAVVDDTNIPIWSEVRPLLTEAIGKKVDAASIFGTDKPASWPTAIAPAATAAGNTVTAGNDLVADIAKLAGLVAQDGFGVNGFLSTAGYGWQLVGARLPNGNPVYNPATQVGTPGSLYGIRFDELANGAWATTTPATQLIALDWTKQIVGIRQDMTFDLFDQMVISDAAGKVIFNAAQQDSKVMRVVFRVGWQTANPLTRENPTAASRYPAGVLRAAA